MSIRPTDLPVTPVHDGEVIRRVDARPEARDRSRQPAHEREDAEERPDAEAQSELAEEGGEDASAIIELSDEFRRDPEDVDADPNSASAGAPDLDERGGGSGARHLDIEA